MSSYKCVVGDLVSFKHDKYVGIGVVKFVGSLLPNKDGLWVGIEREITKSTKSKEIIDASERPEGHNGKLNDMQYFTVRKDRGIFVPYECVESLSKQTELQPWKPPQPSSSIQDPELPSNEHYNDINGQLKKTEQLLEKSLLLLQSYSLDEHAIDKAQIASHCEESWKLLNQEKEIDIKGDEEEKLVDDQQRITGDTKKQIVTNFMSRYSEIANWGKVGKEIYGDKVEAYALKWNTTQTIEVRMSFLYSMMLYLMHCTGSNKRCITHGAILLMAEKQQIETLAKEFETVLETLRHNDDDALWEYVHTFIDDIFNNFAQIKPYSGKRIVLDINNDKKDSQDTGSAMVAKQCTKGRNLTWFVPDI